MDLVDAVERVATHMRQEWGFLITDDAIEFFRKEYDHRHIARGLDQGTLTNEDAAAWQLTLDATDSEINAALAAIPARRGQP
jgi:hypothetical protein